MTGFEREGLAAPVGEPTASMAPRLRVVRIERFEAAVPLADEECEAYRRRFCTLFVDDDCARRGGLGNVAYAQNALGEKLALKTVLAPAREEGEDEESFSKRVEVRRAAFRQEYEGHRALAGFRGVPRLFGYGFVEGEPAIVMEWIEGETLQEARGPRPMMPAACRRLRWRGSAATCSTCSRVSTTWARGSCTATSRCRTSWCARGV